MKRDAVHTNWQRDTVREVRAALNDSYQGRSGKNVYVFYDGEWRRIYAAELRRGRAMGRLLSTGTWVEFQLARWELK